MIVYLIFKWIVAIFAFMLIMGSLWQIDEEINTASGDIIKKLNEIKRKLK